MWNLKNDTNALIYKTKIDSDIENKHMVTKRDVRVRGQQLGAWDLHIHATIYKINSMDLLYSAGDTTQCLLITYNGKESDIYVCVHHFAVHLKLYTVN